MDIPEKNQTELIIFSRDYVFKLQVMLPLLLIFK